MWMVMIRGSGLVGSGVVQIVQRFVDESLPTIAGAPGFLGATVGQNLRRGSALSLAFFEDGQTLRGGERLYGEAQDLRRDEFGEGDPYVADSLKVVSATRIYTELGGTMSSPLMYVVRATGLSPDAVQETARVYGEGVQGHFDVSRGSEGGLVAADPAGGTVVQITFWASEMDMRESLGGQRPSPPPGAELEADDFEIAVARDLGRLPRIEHSMSA
jgi:hypothetical protein